MDSARQETLALSNIARADITRNAAWSYRPSIDGLRSIAVISVLLFHFNKRLMEGGFVGVDIFFVISGYLLTSILLKDIDNQTSIIRFYQRRIARIFPAFFVVIIATLVFSSIIYSATDFAFLGTNTIAASLSGINWLVLGDTLGANYFKISEDARPILHYWSLAVEEQFYLTFPIYLYLITRFGQRAISLNLLICGISFIACVIVTRYNSAQAFYLLPTRAWELLAGTSLAIFERRKFRIRLREATIASWSGFSLLILSLFAPGQTSHFPGWIAVFPVLGTVLLLSTVTFDTLFLTRALSSFPVVAIGRLSYSLYLWHWPTFSLVDYQFYQNSDLFRACLKFGITLAASIATYFLVEKPLRAHLSIPSKRFLTFAGMAVAVIILCTIGIFVRYTNYFNTTPAQVSSGGRLIVGGEKGKIVLVGDSQASMYGKELVSLARARELSLNVLSVDGGNELPFEAMTHWPEIHSFINRTRPDIVVLANDWSYKIWNDPQPLQNVLQELKGHVRHVILLTQQPMPPALASRKEIRKGATGPFFEDPDDRVKRSRLSAIIRSFSSEWVTVIDVYSLFLSPNNEILLFGNNGRLTYQDNNHLSDTGTAKVRPLLERAIDDAFMR